MSEFHRYPSLTFQRKGAIWRVRHRSAEWPFVLYARDIYYGTGRLLATLNFTREDEGVPEVGILTESCDLLTAAQRKRFAKEAAERVARAQGQEGAKFQPSIETMVDAMLERLLEVRNEVEVTDLYDVEVPADLTPKYAVWPLVPVARAGMLVAPSGSGKSTLAGAVAVSVGHEVELIPGIEPRVSGPVIYIGQEENTDQMRARTEMMCRGHGIKLQKSRLIFMKLRGGSLIDSAERIGEQVGHWKAVLVIVDSAQATWGDGGDAIREYASRWFSAVERLGAPTLIIEHPNLAGTKKPGQFLEAAGTSVKRDRSGHVWSVSSVEIPVRPGSPLKYHVTLKDVKRNYVARQPDIIYESMVHGHDWTRFVVADAISSDTVIDGSRTWEAVSSTIRELDEFHAEGWTTAEIATHLKYKDDRRVRQELLLDVWRPHPRNSEIEEKAELVEGTGDGRGNPKRYRLTSRYVSRDPVQMSMAPGDDGLLS
jgi:hypothetical protein